MITGNIKSQIDQIWNAFWSGGVSNPISVIEQIFMFAQPSRGSHAPARNSYRL